MTGRITKRMNLDGVTLSPSPLLLSPLPSRCRSHTGEHNPTSDPHTAKRCKPLRHSANTQHKPQAHSRQVTGARCTEVAARQLWAEYSSSLEEYSLGLGSHYSTVRSGTLTWREWGLWHKPCAYLLGRTVHDNLDCLRFYKRMQRFIIIDFIWYQIGNVPVSSYMIELVVLRFKHRMDLIYFLCMTFIWLMLLNPHTLQPKVNTSWKITWISNIENNIRKMANNNGVRFSPCLATHVTVTIIRYFAVHFRPCVPRRIVSLLWSSPTSAGKPLDPHAPLWPASPENDNRAITHLYSKRDKFVTIRCLRALSIHKYTSHIHVDDQRMIEGSTIVALTVQSTKIYHKSKGSCRCPSKMNVIWLAMTVWWFTCHLNNALLWVCYAYGPLL